MEVLKRGVVVGVGFEENFIEPFSLDNVNAVLNGNFETVIFLLRHNLKRNFFRFIFFDRRKRSKLFRYGIDKFFRVVLNGGANFKVFIALAFNIISKGCKLFVCGKVDFVTCDNLRTFCKLGIEFNKLFVYLFEVFNRVSALTACNVNYMHKHTATLNVT